jgi:hypothetical protein
MKNNDQGEKQQKALPVCIYREIYRRAKLSSALPYDTTIAWLQVLAFFFCIRSCEYSDVKGERRTKTVCVRNVRFFSMNKLIANSSPEIFSSTSVSITFEWQKRDIHDDTITHQVSKNSIGEGIMCPVRAAAELISTLYNSGIPQTRVPNLQLNTVVYKGQLSTTPSMMILEKTRAAVRSLGKERLGFSEHDVGTHSNRSGGAMGMYLSGTPVYTIMLLGRWSSDAFMRYIRKQVLSMSHGVSAKMITYEEFYTVPAFVHNTADGDLQTRNNTNLATSSSFNGSHTNMRRGLHPTFHLEH